MGIKDAFEKRKSEIEQIKSEAESAILRKKAAGFIGEMLIKEILQRARNDLPVDFSIKIEKHASSRIKLSKKKLFRFFHGEIKVIFIHYSIDSYHNGISVPLVLTVDTFFKSENGEARWGSENDNHAIFKCYDVDDKSAKKWIESVWPQIAQAIGKRLADIG